MASEMRKWFMSISNDVGWDFGVAAFQLCKTGFY